MINKSTLLFFLLLFVTFGVSAQSKATLEEQFTDVFDKSNRFEDYKVIKIYKLNSLRKNVNDSLAAIEQELETANAEIGTQNSEISKLKQDVSSLQSQLATSQSKEDGIYLFGSLIKKSTYKTTMWSIIVVLILLALFLLFRFRNSNSVTKSANLKLAEIEEEFESHRQRTLEREQQLRRKLQDEINKQKKTS
ncbi:MAG: tRNA (guanine-N1)-methyltransferase [Flavobacteriaceae bacterium]|nr:tRNA (guanine-N1)-methyltransferase [Flavobacteriaceae bacterium]